jgi:hypothetical protein
MRVFRTIALAACTWLALAPAARAEVRVSLRDGRVTIAAKDATVRQILVEWARVGKTKFVNAERIPGGPITLELKNVPEAEALDILLRSLSGYIAAPRLTLASADASVYDSIVVMPTTAQPAVRTSTPAANAPAPFSPPSFNQNNDDDSDAGAAQGPTRPGAQAVRPPIFSTFPQPQVGVGGNNGARPMLPTVRPGAVSQAPRNTNPNDAGQAEPQVMPQAPAPAAPTATPGGSAGTAAPGMVPPTATSQPGQIAQPQRTNN